MKYTLILFSFFIFALGCKDTVSYQEQLDIDSKKIDTYLSEKGITAQKTASGLYYLITLEGAGTKPGPYSTVTVGYKGYFLNGEVFDETSPGAWAQFSASGVVPGFSEALQLLKKGGRGTFMLPSGLAYGTSGSGGIDPDTPIVFDIELIDFY